jgi:hypothetical protein
MTKSRHHEPEHTHAIEEFDNDYRCYCGVEYMTFESDKAAAEYCKEQSWSGLSYYSRRIIKPDDIPALPNTDGDCY